MNANAEVAEAAIAASPKEQLRAFVACGSTEVTPHDEAQLDEFVRVVPAAFTIYVAHTPKATLDDVVRIALRMRQAGFSVSPHIVARRVEEISGLRRALDSLVAGGVQQILLVAGDRAAPRACFRSTLELLESGVTRDAGITRIGVADHPEGHPAVPEPQLWQALADKQAFARATGTEMHVVTQFGFGRATLGEWEEGLEARGIDLPVYAGVAGPTPMTRLIRFAMQCGVAASVQGLAGNPLRFKRLPHLVTRVDEMVMAVHAAKQRRADSRIFAPHFFAFGGVLATARWLRGVVEGSFELNAAEDGFS